MGEKGKSKRPNESEETGGKSQEWSREKQSLDQWAKADKSSLRGTGLGMRPVSKKRHDSSTMAKAKTNKSSFFIWFFQHVDCRTNREYNGFFVNSEHDSTE